MKKLLLLLAICIASAVSAPQVFAYGQYTGILGDTPYPITYTPSISMPDTTFGIAIYATSTPNLVEGVYDVTGTDGTFGCLFSNANSGVFTPNDVPISLNACSDYILTGTKYLYVFGDYVSSFHYQGIVGYDVLVNGSLGSSYDYTTHFDSTIPTFTATSTVATSTTLTATGYINPDDYVEGMTIEMDIWLRRTQTMGTGFLNDINQGDIVSLSLPISASGAFSVSTSTVFAVTGDYYAEYTISKPLGFFASIIDFFNPLGEGVAIVASTGRFYFTVVEKSALDLMFDEQGEYVSNFLNATSSPVSTACGFTTGNLGQCLIAMFIPSTAQISADIQYLKDTVMTKFPIGYVTDLYTIMSTSTVGSLTVLEATIPSGMAGTGAHLSLDLTGVLDDVLYASTTASFISSTENDTRTLYDITNEYWEKLVYILTAFYVLARVFGKMFALKGLTRA